MSYILLTWFGSGLLPKAPGTWGSLAALPFAWAILFWGNPGVLSISTILIFVLGCLLCIQHVKASSDKDPKYVVIDEVAGQWMPLVLAGVDWRLWLVSFVTFRFFDILKPWPISWIDQRLHGTPSRDGIAIMLDDILAGAFACACVWGVREFLF